jgi:nucleotide-binding universal stress UspA family protein
VEFPNNILKEVMMMANRNVAVLRDRGLSNPIKRILVPVGSGPNARLALQMARDIILPSEDGEIVALRLVRGEADEERLEDEELQVHEIVEQELGEIGSILQFKVRTTESIADAILAECQEGNYDLMIIGSAEEILAPDQIFGILDDYLMEVLPCSMMVVRRHQTGGALWMRKQIKRIEQ